MRQRWDRRRVLGAALGFGASVGSGAFSRVAARAGEPIAAVLADPKPFSFDLVKAGAQALAASPWRAADVPDRAILERIDFESHQKIHFRSEATIPLGPDNRAPIQLFHQGRLFIEPVAIHIVDGGSAREIRYSPELFDSPPDHPARLLSPQTGFAGFRIMDKEWKTDWLSYLGASYFRSSAPYNQYGLSARGLGINTGLDPEEFPRFTAFWLEAGKNDETPLTVYAALNSASVAGAYKMVVNKRTGTDGIVRVVMDVELELYPRHDVAHVGIAAFSSMFWYGEGTRRRAIDWRPEIHDSDGLAILTGAGERIWRPLNNPNRILTSSFLDHDIKGFGLLQRDRDFVHYLDDGDFYERRPTVWVEPQGAWGDGAIQLVELPTEDETNDNIAVFWAPKNGLKADETARYRYRLSWLDDIPFPPALGRVTASWQGVGGDPAPVEKRPRGVRRFVSDWQGPVFAGLTRNDKIEAVVTTSRGRVLKAYCHEVVDQRERWRSVFDIEADGTDPVDMRAFLRRGDTALTETWIGQYFPNEA